MSKHRHYGRVTGSDRLLSLVGLGGLERPVGAGTDESIGEGIARFYPETLRAGEQEVSFTLDGEPKVLGAAPEGFGVRPEFGVRRNGQRIVRVRIDSGTDLYGTGEVAGPLRRNDQTTTLWTSDCAGFTTKEESLYQAHPWVLGVRADGSAFGVLADTTWRCEIDLRDGIEFRSNGPEFPVIVIDRESPEDVLKGLAELTGRMPMPPLWALGYHQCRFSYYPDSRVREIADGFREHLMPCDVIWMDIDYMERFRVFTFDPERFPKPEELDEYLHERGFKSVWMIDPGPAAEDGYFVYEEGNKLDAWIKDKDGEVFTGKVWPPKVVFPDYTRADVCEWWAGLYEDFLAKGVDGVWNDMNEPAVIDSEMPETNLHSGGNWMGLDLPAAMHARYHNVYGFLMVRASREGIRRARPEKRPFLLTRANFLGGHRYAAMWTGDNKSGWDDVRWSISMALNMGLSGQPFAGPDLGGFIGEISGDRFAKWFGFGTLLPFARGHTTIDNMDKEPWAFDEETRATCRRALERRYRLMPYLYTLFWEASRSGLPVCRPVFFADAKDKSLRGEDRAFLVGRDVLVVAHAVEPVDKAIATPGGIWRTFDPVEHDGDERLAELRVRGGAIVPLGPVMQFTGEKALDPLTLVVCLDEDGKAEGVLYEDAGDGHGHLDGDYSLTRFVAERVGDEVVVKSERAGGDREIAKRRVEIVVIGDGEIFSGGGGGGGAIHIEMAPGGVEA